MTVGEFPQARQEPWLWPNGSLQRLHDNGSNIPRMAGQNVLGRLEIVERGDEHAISRPLGDPGYIGYRRWVRRQSRPHVAQHGVIVEAVEPTLELENFLPVCEDPGHAKCEHRRFGAGANKPNLLAAGGSLADPLSQADRWLAQPVKGSLQQLRLGCLHNRRMGMPQEEWPRSHHTVDIRPPARVINLTAFAVVDDESEFSWKCPLPH